MICSATASPARLSSYAAGVADTYTVCPVVARNSSKVSGRLSKAEGSRKPYSTSVSLRDRSPWYMPRIWGTATWLSSMMISASLAR